MIDDMISTGSTMVHGMEALLEAGARPEITIAATHGLLLGDALDRLCLDCIKAILVTDTIAPQLPQWPALHVISVAPLIAAAIQRFQADGSISDLF
jgi:ribose-phosphate pyrophosphokinase